MNDHPSVNQLVREHNRKIREINLKHWREQEAARKANKFNPKGIYICRHHDKFDYFK